MLKVLLLFLVIGLALAKDKQVQEIQSKEAKDHVVKIEPYSMKRGNETEKPESKPYKNSSILRLTRKGRRCGMCGRRAYCLWLLGICRCRRGYRGNPYKRCWRTFQCKRRCGKRAYCQRRTGRCQCKRGYKGNPYTRCRKHLRCKRRCGKLAYCQRRTGKCQCMRGYKGNPYTRCWRHLRCKRRCGKLAYCQRRTGRCQCRRGYKGNPYTRCWRNLRCKGKCGRRAYCHRWTGRCLCQRGFHGNPYRGCWRKVHWFHLGKATICERKKQAIQCHWRKVINIYHVKYGRDNKHTCKSGSIKTTRCSARGATGKLRKACNGKRLCVLHANNSVFGDPCRGTYKFLRVYYGCRRACSRKGFFRRGRCWCKRGFRGNGYRCRRVKLWRREAEHEIQKSTKPMLLDPESSENTEINDVDEARQGKERRSASRRPTGVFPEPDDSEERDERDITDDEENGQRPVGME